MTTMARHRGSDPLAGRLVPFDTIVAAIAGDRAALDDVVRHYEREIISLSSETIQDGEGTTRTQINEEMKRQIENKLIEGVTMRFHLHRDK